MSKERRAQESEGDNKTTDLTAIRQKGREKIKQVLYYFLKTINKHILSLRSV